MKEFHGVWSEHCVADEDLKLHCIAEAGLTVCTDVKITMHGLLQAPVLVEKDAVLCLYGVFEGEIDHRGGPEGRSGRCRQQHRGGWSPDQSGRPEHGKKRKSLP